MSIILRFLVVLATLLAFTTAVRSETTFCWKNTYGTGAGAAPKACEEGRELIGHLCYQSCPTGFQRFGLGCHAVCPEGSSNDGLFCGWASYFAERYVSLSDCEVRHGRSGDGGRGTNGCVKRGVLFYEECEHGYRNVLGFCEKQDISCRHYLAEDGRRLFRDARVANSCAKVIWASSPEIGVCGENEQMDGGLCYRTCGATADRVGPLCWEQCPANWVACGMGCAKDKAACEAAIEDQIVSVVDSAVSIAILVATAGGGSGVPGFGKFVKFLGGSGKTLVQGLTAGTLAGLPDGTGEAVTLFTSGLQDIESSGMTEVEKDHARADAALSLISTIDPTGVSGVVNSYAKPLCGDTSIVANAMIANTLDQTRITLEQEIDDREAARVAKAREVADKKEDISVLKRTRDEIDKPLVTEALNSVIATLEVQLTALEAEYQATEEALEQVHNRNKEHLQYELDMRAR